jgi:hypothetical protein
MKSKTGGIFTLALLITGQLWAQQFSITRVEMLEGKVITHYNLLDTVKERKYTVNVYASRDNFITPLQKVSGDVGFEVTPGLNKKIVWDAPVELGPTFSGKVSLEIRGRVFIPFIRMDKMNKTFKRSKNYEITWKGGRSNNIMNFDLYRGDEKVHTFANVANAGHYAMRIPNGVKPGTYRLRISDTKNKDEVVLTEPFAIKRKVPILVKVLPVVAIAAVITTLGGGPEKTPDLVGPPNTPDGN